MLTSLALGPVLIGILVGIIVDWLFHKLIGG